MVSREENGRVGVKIRLSVVGRKERFWGKTWERMKIFEVTKNGSFGGKI